MRARGSWRSISRRIIPVFNAISEFSYLHIPHTTPSASPLLASSALSPVCLSCAHPFNAAKIVSSFAVRYSTVGHRVPICRRRRVLNTADTSLRAYDMQAIDWLVRLGVCGSEGLGFWDDG